MEETSDVGGMYILSLKLQESFCRFPAWVHKTLEHDEGVSEWMNERLL